MGIELAKAFITVRGDASQFAGDVRNATPGIQSAVGALAASVGGLQTALIGAAGVMSGLNFLKKAGEFEQTMISMKVMLGSAEAAKDTLERLTQFAAETPFEMPEILVAAQGLLMFGERGEGMMDTLKMLGNAASATNTPFGYLANVSNLS